MSADLPKILTLHLEAEARHAARAPFLAEEEAKARENLQKIVTERAGWERDREALRVAGQVYRRMFGLADSSERTVSPSDSLGESASGGAVAPDSLIGRAPLKARVGPQRYWILAMLRALNMPTNVETLSAASGYSPKRVKDQMNADLLSGVVLELDTEYQLTPVGLDLLARFETYKKNRGEPLPSGPVTMRDGDASEEEEDDPHDYA